MVPSLRFGQESPKFPSGCTTLCRTRGCAHLDLSPPFLTTLITQGLDNGQLNGPKTASRTVWHFPYCPPSREWTMPPYCTDKPFDWLWEFITLFSLTYFLHTAFGSPFTLVFHLTHLPVLSPLAISSSYPQHLKVPQDPVFSPVLSLRSITKWYHSVSWF